MQEDVPPPSPDLQLRDRIERARVQALTPGERLAAMQRLIDESWALLEANPEGLARFRPQICSISRTSPIPRDPTVRVCERWAQQGAARAREPGSGSKRSQDGEAQRTCTEHQAGCLTRTSGDGHGQPRAAVMHR